MESFEAIRLDHIGPNGFPATFIGATGMSEILRVTSWMFSYTCAPN